MGNRLGLLWNVWRGARNGRVYKLNFQTTNVCGSRCRTCNIWQVYLKDPEAASGELTQPEIRKLFAGLPPSVAWLSLTGGEPFERPDFPETVAAAVELAPRLRLIGIPCNGLHPGAVLGTVDRLKRRRRHPLLLLSFSIDGPPEMHDRVRGVPGGFARTWELYESARELASDDADIEVMVETTVSRLNAAELLPFLEAKTAAGHRFTVTIAHHADLYRNTGGKGADCAPRGDDADVRGVLDFMAGATRRLDPRERIQHRYLEEAVGFLREPDRMAVPCTALRNSVSLDPYGNVIPCLMWHKPLGNIRETDYRIGPILDREAARATRREIRKAACPNCWTPCEAYQSLIGRIFGGREDAA